MQVVPDWLLDQLYVSFLRGSLAALAMHPLGNFGVQAYLSALQTPQQVLKVLSWLLDSKFIQYHGYHLMDISGPSQSGLMTAYVTQTQLFQLSQSQEGPC